MHFLFGYIPIIEVLTSLLVIITAIYAYISFKIMKENRNAVQVMKEQIETAVRPYITIGTSLDRGMINLIISNTGKTAASNLRLNIDKDFFCCGEKKEENNLRNLSIFKDEIEGFPPGLSLKFRLVQGFLLFGDNFNEKITPPVIKIRASYSYLQKQFIENTTIDLRAYHLSLVSGEPVASKLGKIDLSLKQINRTLINLRSYLEKK